MRSQETLSQQDNAYENGKFSRKPPAKGLSLGWSLALATTLVISLVMGGLTYIQQNIMLNKQKSDRQNLLSESLAPLAARLERAKSLAEIRINVEQFHQAYKVMGYPGHEVMVLAADGRPVFSTSPEGTVFDSSRYFRSQTKVSLSMMSSGYGTLVVFKEATAYNNLVKEEWRFWLIHMLITVVTIFVFLSTTTYFLVTRPVRCLINGVKKMEMGYWRDVELISGAWEIRWLAWRFSNMVAEVRTTITHLFEAEQKAHRVLHPKQLTPPASIIPADKLQTDNGRQETFQFSGAVQELTELCDFLQSSSPDNPQARELALKTKEENIFRAERLGHWELKARIEDAVLRILEPEIFNHLDQELNEIKASLPTWIEKCNNSIKHTLDRKMLPYIEVSHRIKHTAAVWHKMQKKGLQIQEINDLFAFRIIVPTETDCYAVLGVIHELFSPIVSRFKDYIVAPKKNGYQSLHTSVSAKDWPVFEVQIRSVTMHQQAEHGRAAHWLYKKKDNLSESPLKRSWWHFFKSW